MTVSWQDEALIKLCCATTASCRCMTKTPVHSYHAEHCPYRLIQEVKELIKTNAPEKKAPVKADSTDTAFVVFVFMMAVWLLWTASS